MTTPFGPNTHRGPRSAKSRVVGEAYQADGRMTTAYRTVQPHVCARCKSPIAAGSLFSRHSQGATSLFLAGQTRVPVCMTCVPLRLAAEEPGGQG